MMTMVVIRRDLISRKKGQSSPRKSKKQRESETLNELAVSRLFTSFYIASYASLSAMYYAKMTKSQLYVQHISLPSIRSIVANDKK